MKTDHIIDLFVVGGGINGTGIARDAAGRGLSVTLVEQDDLAAHTSSASSKLIHGGLRYLEHYEFRLVRESLKEREILLRAAPHIISPLRFVLPHHKAMRPALLLRLGLFLYDHIGGRDLLPATATRDLQKHPVGQPLKAHFKRGFEYSDCWVDDSRLVCLTAKDAHKHGANILVGYKMVGASRKDGAWQISVLAPDGESQQFTARTLVNAAGPWVDTIESKILPAPQTKKQIKMVKGSHIIVPRLYDGEQAYTFQNDDGRVVFAIPYEKHFTLIGTTDVPYKDDPSQVTIQPDETEYLCSVASRYFNVSVEPDDITWAYSGVRPLVDDGSDSASKTTRDYVLELDEQEGAPILSIYGGKITTFRRLAEEVLEALQPYLGFSAEPWTDRAPLPGGQMGYNNLSDYRRELAVTYPWVPDKLLDRYLRAYGTDTKRVLSYAPTEDSLGHHFGAGLYEAELTYMHNEEWVNDAESALWRRSKLGLHMTKTERLAVAEWFKN